MPSREFEEPIWKRQKWETPKQYNFFTEYLKYPSFSLKGFHEHISQKQKDLSDGKSDLRIPKYETIRNWSSLYKWTKEKKLKEPQKTRIFLIPYMK